MWLGNGYTIPMVKTPKGPVIPPPPSGDFIELEPNLFLVALETALTDKIELE